MRQTAERWVTACSDEVLLRWLLRGMIAATIAVLALDFGEKYLAPEQTSAALPGVSPAQAAPNTATPSLLPSLRRAGDPRRAPLRNADAQLKARMSFELVGDGRLIATGTIEPGTAAAFKAEIEKRGAYVKTVVLHSPGGSVQDALVMGRLIRDKKFATEVESGRYCASSCPLVFAAGIERRAGEKAAIGVHQVAAAAGNAPGDEMAQTQRITAQCQRYLADMGVDLQVWVHAMETPKDELFTFKPDELLALKLATATSAAKPQADARAKS